MPTHLRYKKIEPHILKTHKLKELFAPYYLGRDKDQTITSSKTSRKQKSRGCSFVVLSELVKKGVTVFDLGCGHDTALNKLAIENAGGTYLYADLYNQEKESNIKNIEFGLENGCDVVMINNVLNVIKEEVVRVRLLMQAKSLLKPSGLVVISIFEGTALVHEKKSNGGSGELVPTETKDGWQNRMKTEEYLSEIQSILPEAKVSRVKGCSGKFIVARVS